MIDSFLTLPLWPLLKQLIALGLLTLLVLFAVLTFIGAVIQMWRKSVAAAARRIQDNTHPKDQP